MTPVYDPAAFREQNRDFWEERGRQTGSGLAVTMMAEHERFLEHIHRVELRFLKRRLAGASKPRLLDLGCGSGRLAVALAPLTREVVGIELAESLVAQARTAVSAARLSNVRIEVGSVDDTLPASAFDLVTVSGVLNCVDDSAVARCLQQVLATLVPNGRLYLRNHCATSHAFFRPAGPNEPPCLFRTSAEYRQAVDNAGGFEVLEDRYLFPPLCWPNLAYYHALPRSLRGAAVVRGVLDGWFAVEERTAEARVRAFSRFYPWVLKAIGKPTAFNVIVARKK